MAEIPITKIGRGDKLLIVNTCELQTWIDDGWKEIKPIPPKEEAPPPPPEDEVKPTPPPKGDKQKK